MRFFDFSIFFLFLFPVVRAHAKTGKNRREVLFVKMAFFFERNLIFGGQVKGSGMGPFEGDPLSCFCVFHFLFFLGTNVSFFLYFSNMFHCWHLYQSLTVDVFSVVGASMEMWCLDNMEQCSGLGWATHLGESMIQLTRVAWRLLAC